MFSVSTLVGLISTISIWRTSTGQSQRFTAQPQDLVVNKGQLFIINCSVANLVGNVQWLRDQFGLGPGPTFDGYPRYRIDNDTRTGRYSLIVANAQLEDDAAFQCQVGATDLTDGLQSTTAHITVQLPAQSVIIGDGSPTVQVVANATFSLRCAANNARPAASLSWQTSPASSAVDLDVESTAIQTVGKLSTTTGSLVVRPGVVDDGRQYSCMAVNNASLSPVSASVRLSVVYAPQVTVVATPGDNIREFDRVVFTCSAAANPPVNTWRWYLGDELQTGVQGTSLVVDSITRLFTSRPVSCVAANEVGDQRASITVNMTYGPQFTSTPVDQAADLGATQAVLLCPVDSNPPAEITWTRTGSPLPVLGRTAQLTINPVTRDSFCSYTCSAAVSGFASISANLRLVMNGPPSITSSPEQSASLASTVTVDCSVSSTPRASSIVWTTDGQLLDLDLLTRYKIVEMNVTGGSQSLLTISNVQDSDFRSFNCTASNNYGSATFEITLTKRASVPIGYILAGVIPGIVLVVIIVAVVFVCLRRRSLGSELGSDNSETQMTKHVADSEARADSAVESPMAFSNGRQQTPLDNSPKHEPSSGSYSVRSPSHSNSFQYYDSWGQPIDIRPTSPAPVYGSHVYGTAGGHAYNDAHPARPARVITYRGDVTPRPECVDTSPSPNNLFSNYPQQQKQPFRHPPAAALHVTNRLATNV